MTSHNRRKQKSEPKSYEFSFDGGLESSVRGGLLVELIKYILYERQQIPAPYDWLVSDLKKFTEQEKSVSHQRNQKRKNVMEMKRAFKAITSLQEIFQEILVVFEQCPEIKHVMLVLGSTTLSPKESYLINFPPSNPEADNLALKACTKTLFRQLIVQDLLNGAKCISPTSLTVLICAPRTMEMSWFLPNNRFKWPSRGERFIFDLLDNGMALHDHSMLHCHDIDMSGVEPLESSAIDLSFIDRAKSLLDATDVSSSSLLSSDETDTTSVLLRPFSDSDLSSRGSVSSESGLMESKSNSKKFDMGEENHLQNEQTNTESNQQDRKVSLEHRHVTCHSQTKGEVGMLDIESHFMWFQAPLKFRGYKSKQ